MSRLTPEEAWSKMNAGYTYVDVRSDVEFELGRPAGAVNVRMHRAADPDNDKLSYRWVMVRETNKKNKTGGWDTQQFAMPKGIVSTNGTRVTFKAASGVGGYRIFVYVLDGHGNAASANFPFEVTDASTAPAATKPEKKPQ